MSNVRVIKSRLYLFLFSIFILFSIYFLVLNLELEFSMISQVTITLLFSLLPLSCIVAPIENIANKLFFSRQNPNLSTTNYSQTLSIPTMLPYGMGMDIQSGLAPNNFNKVRGRTLSSNGNISRDVSISSTKSSVVYHERMTTNNVNNDNDPVNASPELSYETE